MDLSSALSAIKSLKRRANSVQPPESLSALAESTNLSAQFNNDQVQADLVSFFLHS